MDWHDLWEIEEHVSWVVNIGLKFKVNHKVREYLVIQAANAIWILLFVVFFYLVDFLFEKDSFPNNTCLIANFKSFYSYTRTLNGISKGFVVWLCGRDY